VVPALAPILRDLITASSLPLKVAETDFAVDASGFSTCRFVQWYHAGYGHEQDNYDWIKVHLMTGVKTNVVTSVEISGRYAHDGPLFPALVDQTARNFALGDVAGDKAYSSIRNLGTVTQHGGTPYVPFKTRATGENESVLWNRPWGFYTYRREEFLAHYHRRPNAESTFSMIKAKFGSALRSKTDAALVNEAVCKVLCHNLCVVIQSMHEIGVEPTFRGVVP